MNAAEIEQTINEMRDTVVRLPLPETPTHNGIPGTIEGGWPPLKVITEGDTWPITIGSMNEREAVRVVGKLIHPLRTILGNENKKQRHKLIEEECSQLDIKLQSTMQQFLLRWIDAPVEISKMPIVLFGNWQDKTTTITVVFYKPPEAERTKPAVPKRKSPCSPDPSNGGDSMPMVTAPIPHFWGQALTAGGTNTGRMESGWEKNTVNQHPKFARTRITHKGGEATVYFDAKGYSALELWGKVYSIDDLVLETYTVILALMSDARNACPPGYVKRFYINPAQILELKGFRRWGEDRRVALRRVIDAIKLLSEWTTDYSGFPLPPDKKGKPRFAEQRGCKIFHVLSSWHAGEQGELFENEQGDLEHAPLSIHCVSGDWLAHWMNEDGGYFWVQSIPRKLLEIPGNTDAERYAKRIGMLILGFVAGTDHINKEVCWTVRKILQDLVMLPTEEYRGLGGRETKKGIHWANHTDKALFGYLTDEVDVEGNDVYEPGAFDILLEYGVLARYRKGDEDHPYPDPGCRGAGWQERWLETPVYMTTPEAAAKIATNPLPDSLTQEQVVPREKPAIPGTVLRKWTRRGTGKPKKKLAIGQYLDTATAERLRVEIARHFPNQIKAAEHFGCTQSGLSRVLSRNRAPGVELAAKIKAFLDSLEGIHGWMTTPPA